MKQYKPRDKITQKMTRDGLVEVNETRQTAERVSSRERDADFSGKKEPEAPQGKTRNRKSGTTHGSSRRQNRRSRRSNKTRQHREAAQPFPSSPRRFPLPHAPGAAPKQDTGTTERASWSVSTQPIPARQAKRRQGKHRRKRRHKRSRPACSLPKKNFLPRNWKSTLRSPTGQPTVWTRQRQLSRNRKNLSRSVPLTKPPERQRPAYALRNGKSPCPEAGTIKPAVPPRAGSGYFLSTTRYIP